MRSSCDSSIGLLVNIPLNAVLKRVPRLAESDLQCFDAMRTPLDDRARTLPFSLLLLDMVPGKGTIGAGGIGPAVPAGQEKEEEFERVSGGDGGAFGPTCF